MCSDSQLLTTLSVGEPTIWRAPELFRVYGPKDTFLVNAPRSTGVDYFKAAFMPL